MFSSFLLKNKIFTHLKRYRRTFSDITDDSETGFDAKQMQQFKKMLKNRNIASKDGFTCLQTECKLCNKCTNKPLAFINKTTGTFICPTCEITQPLSTAIKFYENRDSYQPLLNSLQNFIEYKHEDCESLIPPTQEICDVLKISGMETSILENLGVKHNSTTNLLHFPLTNVAGLIVGEKIYDLTEKFDKTYPEDNCSGVLMYPNVKGSKAILVLNVQDFLSLVSQKIEGYTLICLPYGLKSLPQSCLPALDNYKELILWFDFSSADWDTSRNFARKLGEKRCLFIRPTDTQQTPYKSLRKKLNLKHIIQRAQPILHQSITTFSALKQDILSELQNIEKVNGVKWKRFPVLNKLMKGHRKGELTILTGPTGCGKTTFMSEYSLDLALQGVSTLWGSFEIRNTRLASTLLRQYAGYSLEDKLDEFEYWANEFEKFPVYFMTFHGQQSIKVVMEAIEHAQYVHDVTHVIIDNVQFMMGVSAPGKNDKFYEQDAIIAAFRGFATKRNVHVTLVMHPRKERDTEDLTTSSIFGSAKATQEADNVLIIQDKRLTSVRGKKYLQIAKNRYSGDLGIMPMEFDKDALSYAHKKKKDSK